jgi:hypothetical protein
LKPTSLENLNADDFTIKLNTLGKLSVRHKQGILRKLPFTSEVKEIEPKRKVRLYVWECFDDATLQARAEHADLFSIVGVTCS